jgi:hypothetical protein
MMLDSFGISLLGEFSFPSFHTIASPSRATLQAIHHSSKGNTTETDSPANKTMQSEVNLKWIAIACRMEF